MVRCRKVGAKNYNIGGKKSGKKVTGSGSGLAAIRAKAGSTAKRVVPVAVNPVRAVGLTQPAGQQWRNAKVLTSKQRSN